MLRWFFWFLTLTSDGFDYYESEVPKTGGFPGLDDLDVLAWPRQNRFIDLVVFDT